MRTLLLSLLLASAVLRAQSGDWMITSSDFGAINYLRADLKFEGGTITGHAGEFTVNGTFREGRVEFETKNATNTVTRTGTFTGNEMKGTGIRNGNPFEWSARRIMDKPATPRTHTFTPTVFHNYFTSTVPPVLTIFPGDTVESW